MPKAQLESFAERFHFDLKSKPYSATLHQVANESLEFQVSKASLM